MNAQLLHLHFSQLVNAWGKSKHNQYSDSAKQEYHNNLSLLFDKLKETDFVLLDDAAQNEIKNIIDFFILNLEFLDNSTFNNAVPFEIIECLKVSLNEWVDNFAQYIIVTSYGQYSFNPFLVSTTAYSIIESRFGITFNKKLIQINLPKHLSRDYLTNTVLYHELGHFVDVTLSISDRIAWVIWNNYHANRFNDEILAYFPFMDSVRSSDTQYQHVLSNHISEYLSDLFACQYVEKAAYHYLSYIASTSQITSTHPSTDLRIRMMDEFLGHQDRYSYVVKEFCNAVKIITDRELKKRYIELSENDILSLIPCEISKQEELSSLFKLGWDIWLHKTNELAAGNAMTNLKPGRIYRIINNLIEKSISNFIVMKNWRKHVSD